jgi:5'(3')-deoxyribonucleotidase
VKEQTKFLKEKSKLTNKAILYFDMDGVLADFHRAIREKVTPELAVQYGTDVDQIPGIFNDLHPIPGAIFAFEELSRLYDVYILSTAPWGNPEAWMEKRLWVEKHLGDLAHKRLILSHNKHLNRGDYLIDDRLANGADRFEGEHILFGGDEFPTWLEVLKYLA